MVTLLFLVAVSVSVLSGFRQVSGKSEVYAALLSGAGYHGIPGSRMLVKREWLPMPPVSEAAVPQWLKEFEAVPAELREALRRSAVLPAGAVDPSLFPVGTKFISSQEIAAVFTGALQDNWAVFKRQYRSEGWVSFSDVLVTSDSLDALVYSEASCGGLCGEGAYIWLHRKAPGSPWAIMKSVTTWIA